MKIPVHMFQVVGLCIVLSLSISCSKAHDEKTLPASFSIAVYVPGVIQGSPTYEMMVDGVRKAVEQAKLDKVQVDVKVIEGGFNQGDWQAGVTALASTNAYNLIVTSNPSLPERCAAVALSYPNQKFLVLDGKLDGNKNIKTIYFDQYQQAWLQGHFAGLVLASSTKENKGNKTIGLLAGQEYPIMLEEIKPGFLDGARSVDPSIKLDFRVLGNWFDADKASSIARDMADHGAEIILTIAGGGNQGVIAAAKEKGFHILWFDSTGYDQGPGVVIGSSVVKQSAAAEEAVLSAIKGKLVYGTNTSLGIVEGAVTFNLTDPLFIQYVPKKLRDAQAATLEAFIDGTRPFPKR